MDSFSNYHSKTKNYAYLAAAIYLFLMLFAFSCGTSKKAKKSKQPAYQQIIENSPVFNSSFTGFQLFDPATTSVLYSSNADKYFTPASNTKIFTLYSALEILGDSIPALRYIIRSDSLIFWGTGDPSFLHPYLSPNEQVADFLKRRKEQLFYSAHNFQDQRYGPGWAWDDYNDYYQPEKSAFPVHGNVVQFDKKKDEDFFEISPRYFSSDLSVNDELETNYITRLTEKNIFEYNKEKLKTRAYANDHPFKYSDALLVNLLSFTLGKEVKLLEKPIMPPEDSRIIYSVASDTLYHRLMQESDNFIAEQLLLLCSNALFDTLNSKMVIDYALDSLLNDLPDRANWNDGSGLSRYNLFTPRTIVQLLYKIHQKISLERILHIFPAGGESGTIANWYGNTGKPFVFAKTGTLRNKHCLSGYLLSSQGKVLIFSFMHNNYPGGSSGHKKEMERVLRAIYLEY